MSKLQKISANSVLVLIVLLAGWPMPSKNIIAAAATQPAIDLSTGWSLLKEGEAEVTMQQDARHPTNTDPHLLYIAAIKTAPRGKGRGGAINSTLFSVQKDQLYDITFTATTRRRSVGLVFSLETADGKVLARTTLPEIGRATANPPSTTLPAGTTQPWNNYLVALRSRGSDSKAHLVITPIEPAFIWLDHLMLIPGENR